ncbi:MAG: hypothetical protein WKG07_00925 [Hymenobacter sp.]
MQGFDRFDKAWNKNGIQRVTVRVNGQPHYQHIIDAVPFPNGTRQVNNFVDFAYARTHGRTLQKLWVDEGNDLPFYTPPGLGQGKLDVEAGKVYTVDFELADAYNNKATARLVLRGDQPADYARLPRRVRLPRRPAQAQLRHHPQPATRHRPACAPRHGRPAATPAAAARRPAAGAAPQLLGGRGHYLPLRPARRPARFAAAGRARTCCSTAR